MTLPFESKLVMDGTELKPYLLAASCAGAGSWVFLNRHTVRGDYALVFYVLFAAILHYFVQASTWSYSPLLVTLSLISAYFASLAATTVGYRLSPWHPLAQYPGPTLWKVSSLFLSKISLTGRRHKILDRLHQRYGPILRIAPNTLSINTPSAVSMYQTMEKSEAYRRPARIKVVTMFFKNEHEKLHRERKKIWATLFTPSGQMELMPSLETRAWNLMQCLERRQSESPDGLVDLSLAVAHWSYDFMGDMVFGGCNKYELMKNGDPRGFITTGKNAIVMLDSIGQSPWLMDILWHIPTSKTMRRLISNSREMMLNRLKTKPRPGQRDLMSYLIEAGVPQLDLEREALVAIQAGSDNTSITMSLSLYFLLAEPRYYKKLQAELDKAFPNPTGPLPVNELMALPLLNAAINETLRFSSPYFIPRIVPDGGAVIEGKYIPAKTIVALAAYSQQTSAENFYPDPQTYRPERWLEGGLGPETKTNRAALASFSFGPHACVAKNFAYQEMRFVLARLILAYDMELPKDFDIQGFRDGILNMRTTLLEKKLFVRVTRRPGVDLDRAFAAVAV
ncbi:cytochrome P450 [Polyporus arcularius HHB13444]|uniref:Cytochrome P450 n=1 Tax=Polyporus arcularius HHB13444 TaxID=1314778 RepID=A0A5C3PRQ3_9APHY|nr:cytochrome P450 [Polyporus arcularius HHB13444]